MEASFFKGNRQQLRARMSVQACVVAGNNEVQRRGDAAYPFVQDANFYYLTGINEPGWKLVIDGAKEFLIAPKRSSAQTLFDGSLSDKEATAISGVEQVLSEEHGRHEMEKLSEKATSIGTVKKDPHQKYYGFAPNEGPAANLRALTKLFESVEDIRGDLLKLRAIKQPQEIDAIRRAISVSVRGFNKVKDTLSTLVNERQVEALLSLEFTNDSDGHAYDPIVAAGSHACTLHYDVNSGELNKGELLLIDAGARQYEYAADITRTYSIGEPTDRQVAVHRAVETAHYEIINLLGPGVSTKEYIERVDEVMIRALKELDLYKDPEDYRRYFPHAISHGLGIDVHDSLGGYKEFQPGMVLTVEPGIYIPEEGIGVRIEDDILITEDGYENLSAALPTVLY